MNKKALNHHEVSAGHPLCYAISDTKMLVMRQSGTPVIRARSMELSFDPRDEEYNDREFYFLESGGLTARMLLDPSPKLLYKIICMVANALLA